MSSRLVVGSQPAGGIALGVRADCPRITGPSLLLAVLGGGDAVDSSGRQEEADMGLALMGGQPDTQNGEVQCRTSRCYAVKVRTVQTVQQPVEFPLCNSWLWTSCAGEVCTVFLQFLHLLRISFTWISEHYVYEAFVLGSHLFCIWVLWTAISLDSPGKGLEEQASVSSARSYPHRMEICAQSMRQSPFVRISIRTLLLRAHRPGSTCSTAWNLDITVMLFSGSHMFSVRGVRS